MMTPINDDDYESLLEEYARIYEDLEITMGVIDLMLRDLKAASEEIKDDLLVIDRRLNRCKTGLHHAYKPKHPKNMSFQGSYHAPGAGPRQT